MRRFFSILTIFLGLGCVVPRVKAADTDVSVINNTIYCKSQQVEAGATLSLSLLMKNNKPCSGFQLDVVLPKGYEFVLEDGFYVADLSTARKVSSKTHSLDAELQDDGSLRVLCYSAKNFLFDGNDGEVAIVGIKVLDDVPVGPSTIKLKEIVLTDANGVTIEAGDVTFTLSIPNAENLEVYDINKDGHVNVADVMKLTDFILRHPERK